MRKVRALLFVCCLVPGLARAQAPATIAQNDLGERYTIDEQAPETSVPTPEQAMRNPLEMGYLLMDLIARAHAATARGDHAAAVRFHRAIVKAVPQRAVAHADLCKAHEAAGDRPQALESCKRALGLEGVSLEDYAHYVRLVLAQPGELSTADLDDVEAIIAHLTTQLAGAQQASLLPAQLSCDVATRLNDDARLERCSSELARVAPDHPGTVTFQWALALARHDLDAGRAVIDHAKTAGLPANAVAEMETRLSLEAQKPNTAGALRALAPFGLIALLAALGFRIARKRTPAPA